MTETPIQDEQGGPENDSAWVTIETPYGVRELRPFLDDVERLYRINAMLIFEEWRQTGDDRYQMKVKNLSNDKELKTNLDVIATEDGITVRYSDGLRTSTAFRVEAQADGTASLIVTDDYSGTSLAERQDRIDEVDKGLSQWGVCLHRYLKQWKRWSWLPGWKFYMRRVWQPMKPMGRRIAFLLVMVTAAEFVGFLFVFTIFWLELEKYLD